MQPTVGKSYDVDEGARLFFESWLPLRWQKRRLYPDIHVDYRVEVVESGEPMGLHFQAQVKGRSVHKRKTKSLTEPFKTKHLRYYLRCEEPVFLFLIDPVAKEGHWLFIQRYLKENKFDAIPRAQKTLTVQFNTHYSTKNQPFFEKELRDAWGYIRDLHPGSPIAAILAEKRHLEQLLSGHSIQIVATDESMHIQATSPQSLVGGMKLEFLKNVGADEWKAFTEKGQSFQVKAGDLQASGNLVPIGFHQMPDDARVTIRSGNILSFKGGANSVWKIEYKRPDPTT
ncbi:MAG: DUF4365 domain-containing protein [Limisphaerales bacterium]